MVTLAIGAGADFHEPIFLMMFRCLKYFVFTECKENNNLLTMFALSARTPHANLPTEIPEGVYPQAGISNDTERHKVQSDGCYQLYVAHSEESP